MLAWVETPDNRAFYQRKVTFLGEFNGREERDRAKMVTESFTFMFTRDSLESFTKEEWLEVYRYHDEILPQVFPEANIQFSETRHPAVFTDRDVLLQIQAETKLEIPEKYLYKLKDPETSE